MGGHQGIVSFASQLADELWIVPVYRHAYPDKRQMASYEDRREMARLAFERFDNVRVIDTERDLSLSTGSWVGTIDVMRALLAKHPDVQFSLLLGGDTYRDLLAGKWKESEALVELVPILVISRTGVSLPAGTKTLEAPGLTGVSSSAVRASQDSAYLHEALDPVVLDYIQRHGLYRFARPEGPAER
jgi:nicotinate-nucleotide adenylyltransferase